jgi:thioredoxin reductase
MADLETALIGAGPYGLSIAAHLKARGLPYQMFGTPLVSWRKYMPEGMVLKSERFASNLWDPARRFTLERYSAERRERYQPVGLPLPLATFLDYADWFRDHAGVEARDVQVTRIERAPAGFRLALADGATLTSRRVVLATGHMAYRVLPPELAHLPAPRLLHTALLGDVKSYRGRDVTVIGAGQSALESAALLHEAGARVRVLARGREFGWNLPSKPRGLMERIIAPDAGVASGWKSFAISELPRVFRWYFPAAKRHRFVAGSYGPSGSWWLRERVEGRCELVPGAIVRAAEPLGGQVRLVVERAAGRSEILTDHVIAGTGFKVDVDRLDYLDAGLRAALVREGPGIAALDAHFETSVPGLFIVGVTSAPVFGPIMRFMYGAKHVAPVLARRLRSAA